MGNKRIITLCMLAIISIVMGFASAQVPDININLLNPQEGAAFTTSDVTISYGGYGPGQQGTCELYVNNQLKNSTPLFVNADYLATYGNGGYSWYVKCSNATGAAKTSESRTFSVNAPVPSLEVVLTSPANNTEIVSPFVELEYSVSSDSTQAVKCGVYLNGAWIATSYGKGSKSAYLSNQQNGNYTWYVSCNVSTVTKTSETRVFSLKPQTADPISITLNNPANNRVFNITNVSFMYNVGTAAGNLNCKLYIDGEVADSKTAHGTTFFSKEMQNGIYSWYVYCANANGTNATSETREFRVNVPVQNIPSLTVVQMSPLNGAVLPGGWLYYSYNVSTNSTASPVCNTYLDGVVVATETGAGVKSFRTEKYFTPGNYNWKVSCAAGIANATTDTWAFTIQSSEPTTPAPLNIMLTSPQNNTAFASTPVNLGYYVPGGASANCEVYLNGQVVDSRLVTSTYTHSAIVQTGEYEWYVKCTGVGTAGNGTSGKYRFTVSLPQPPTPQVTVSIDNPEDGYVSSLANVTLMYRAFTTNPGQMQVSCAVYVNDAIKDTRLTQGTTFFTSEYANGNYDWYVKCTDDTGATNMTQVRSFVVSAPASKSPPAPISDGGILGGIMDFIGSIFSGVANFIGGIFSSGKPADPITAATNSEFYSQSELADDADASVFGKYIAKYTPEKLNENENVKKYVSKLSGKGYKSAQVMVMKGERTWFSAYATFDGEEMLSFGQVYENRNAGVKAVIAKDDAVKLLNAQDMQPFIDAYINGKIKATPSGLLESLVLG
ncbi:hypothetical protein FJZ26_00040 [Candidatus Parvarchaeota archaeon]|nr:hypothetical protein [Candidatus Parvarchaeota archaeon]